MCMKANGMLKIYISSEITSHAVLECVKKFALVERVDWMEDAKKKKKKQKKQIKSTKCGKSSIYAHTFTSSLYDAF